MLFLGMIVLLNGMNEIHAVCVKLREDLNKKTEKNFNQDS